MNKVQIAFNRIKDVLAGSGSRSYTLKALLWEVNWALDLEEMVSLSTLRKAVALLPQECVKRDRKGFRFEARGGARATEVVEALRVLDLYDPDVPVLIERQRDALRRELVLCDGRALYHTLEWASTGNFEIDHTVYGTMLRWERKAA